MRMEGGVEGETDGWMLWGWRDVCRDGRTNRKTDEVVGRAERRVGGKMGVMGVDRSFLRPVISLEEGRATTPSALQADGWTGRWRLGSHQLLTWFLRL